MKKKNILTLIVTKKWFDLINTKEKTEDFREIKEYWNKRLKNNDWTFKIFDYVKIANWYSKNRSELLLEFQWIRITWIDEKTDLWIWYFFAIKLWNEI